MKKPEWLFKDLPLKLVALVILIALLWWPLSQAIPGDWKGQIVDKETGKPLEGVVVLAVWERYFRGLGIHGAAGGYGASEEAVTDKQGQFTIKARSSWTLNPFVYLKGPEFHIFRSGYGRWEFQGYDTWGKDPIVRREHFEKLWKQFRREGVVLEIPPLKTQKKRLAFLSSAQPATLDIPPAHMRRYFEAIDREAMELGRAPVESLEMKQREREQIWKEYREKSGKQR